MATYDPPKCITAYPYRVSPSCETCVHGLYDQGDPSVGQGDSWECENPYVSDWVFDLPFEDYAKYCNHYTPHEAGTCGQCGKHIPGSVLDVVYWCDAPFADELVPACSGECALDSIEAAGRLCWTLHEPEEFIGPADVEEDYPTLCPHGERPEECSACLAYGDFRADCDREARHFGSGRNRF